MNCTKLELTLKAVTEWGHFVHISLLGKSSVSIIHPDLFEK